MASGKLTVNIVSETASTRATSVVEIQPRQGWTDPWSELAEELIASGQDHHADEVVRHAARLDPHDPRVQDLRRQLAQAS